jgi:hypothetical protein
MLGANIWWWTWARKRQQHQPLPEIGLICEESYLFLALYLAGKGVALSSLISNDSVQKIMNASQDDKSKELKNFVSLHVLNHYVSINKVAAESFWHFCQAKGPILPHDIKVIMARYMNEALIEENRATIEASGLLKEGIAAGLSMTTAYVSKEKGKVTIYQPSEQELAAWNKTAEQAEASLEKDSHEFVAKLAAGKLGKNTEEKRIYYKLIQDSMRSLKDEPSFPAFLNHTARSEAVKKLSELKDISDETVTNTLKAIN